jgi:hypothetical protein
MGKITGLLLPVLNNFFLAATLLLMMIYIRWFQLTPLMLNGHNDSDGALVFGFILLTIHLVSVLCSNFWTHRNAARTISLCLSMLFLYVNIHHAIRYFPLLENDAKCEHARYYITWGHPFGDYQWTNYTLTKWENAFTYETSFFGYTPSAGPFEIVCDNDNEEANILKIYPADKILDRTDGERPRGYINYTSAEMKDKLYFLSEQCNNWRPYTCESTTYTLISCNMEYKSCRMLPVQYTDEDDESYELIANETTNEIVLYVYDDYNTDDRTVIFTYGERSRCYVEGCEILQESAP